MAAVQPSTPPTPLRISTITAVGNVGVAVDLRRVFDGVAVLPDASGLGEGAVAFVYSELFDKTGVGVCKGSRRGGAAAADRVQRVPRIDATGSSRKTHFDNQVTLIARLSGTPTQVNIKLFRNGRVQMTGIRDIDQGRLCVDALVREVRALRHLEGSGHGIQSITYGRPAEDVQGGDYRVCMINSNFHAGFQVRRERLYDILATRYPHIMTSFEPCIYPGVKIRFSWNAEAAHAQSGACPRTPRCNGSSGQACCQRITIIVFRSGCVIITGGRDERQLGDAYAFVNALLAEHRDAVERRPS